MLRSPLRLHMPMPAILRWAAFGCLLALVAGVHLARLDEVPRGLFVDESSIGLNAASIAESGRDEHGVRWPVYFRAFGEYKNPVYIYAAALVFRLAGVSVWTLRLTSFLFFLLLLGGIACLVRRAFPGSISTLVFALAAAGLLPWFFTVSRIAFEVISQPAVMAWALCLAFAVYEGERPRPTLALGLGILAGLSIYTYSTARLLTPVFLLTLLAAYAPRRFWRRHALVLAGAAAAAVPYVLFSLNQPGALVKRFRKLTYVFDESLSPGARLATFLDRYGYYWSPRYLLVEGDFNRRNSTGHAGEVYVVVLVLAVIGLAWAIRRRPAGRGRFTLLLAANLLAAPAAAALTSGTSALRTILLGLYLLVFACFGFYALTSIQNDGRRRAALAAVALALAVESGRYVSHYFGPYVEQSVWAFKSYDFEGALTTAIRQRPHRIEVSWRANKPYAHLRFYQKTLPPHPEITMVTSPRPRAAPGVCVIVFNRHAFIPAADRFPSRSWGLDDPTILRCYYAPRQRPPRGGGFSPASRITP